MDKSKLSFEIQDLSIIDATLLNEDRWGCAICWYDDGKLRIGAEYNFCREEYEGYINENSAIYCMHSYNDGTEETDSSDYEPYTIDFTYDDWKGKLQRAMENFVIERVKDEEKRYKPFLITQWQMEDIINHAKRYSHQEFHTEILSDGMGVFLSCIFNTPDTDENYIMELNEAKENKDV